MPGSKLEDILRRLSQGANPTDREVASALSELRTDFQRTSDILFDDDLKLAVYSLIQRGIELADEDLFIACDEHDSLRRLVYRIVKLMDPEKLEETVDEILARDLERTLLGSYIMRRVLGGRGGGT